ncbi:hypothetical protein [Haladaptatus sp. CMAA 1911]|uniref:hypothetical protein n=1 Tax=unclassified Haladaptatus TaxID=2622732 RepID=UPI0037541CD4
MATKQVILALFVFCTLVGAIGCGGAVAPIATPSNQTAISSEPVTNVDLFEPRDVSLIITGQMAQVSDCDIVDIDGNNNTLSLNLTSDTITNITTKESVQLHCQAGSATAIDHDLVDIDGNNNTVRVIIEPNIDTISPGVLEKMNNGQYPHHSLECGADDVYSDCDLIDVDGNNNSVQFIVRNITGQSINSDTAVDESINYQEEERNTNDCRTDQ